MPTYTVADGHKKINGKKYAPGDPIECSAEIAARLRLVPVEDKPPIDKKPTKLLAADAIAAIGACKTIDEVKEFFKDEERPTVIDAARAKIKAIKDGEKAPADKK